MGEFMSKSERNRMWVRLHVEGRMTVAEIGERYGMTRERVRQIVRRLGVPASITKEIARASMTKRVRWTCEGCGVVEWMVPSDADRRKFCSPACSGKNRDNALGPDELIEDLKALAERLGRTPSTADINEHSSHCHMNYHNHFGSLRRAQEIAGLEPNELLGPERTNGRGYTEEELLSHLRDLANDFGRTPTLREVREVDGPSTRTYEYRFGSHNEAVRAAGLTPNKGGRPVLADR